MGVIVQMTVERDEPCFVISVAARLVNMHPQTLRYYEKLGLIAPSRSRGRIRLYSAGDIARLQQIHRLIDDLGVNLAGVEVIMHMNSRISELEHEIERLRDVLRENRLDPDHGSRPGRATGTDSTNAI